MTRLFINYIIEYKEKYGSACINLTNFKEEKNEIVGWNFQEQLKEKGIIYDCENYFMVQ